MIASSLGRWCFFHPAVRAIFIAFGHLKPLEGLTEANAGVVMDRVTVKIVVATMRFSMVVLSLGNRELSRVHTPPLNVKQISQS